MARMLGEQVIPRSVNLKRRQLRSKLRELREPIRRRRSEMVPGPDVVGQLESRINQTTDKIVRRDGVVDRIKQARSGGSNGGSSGGSSSQQTDSDSNNGSSQEVSV